MAFIKLTSENEKLSFILEKNPATQVANGAPFKRNSKMYSNFLWFENDNHVSLFSKYLNPKNTKSKFENLDFTQYTKGEVYLQLIDNLLRSALNKDNELDTQPAQLVFTVYNHAELDYKERLPHVVKDCVTRYKQSTITIEAPTVKKALETCCLISLITSFYDENYYVENDQYIKYLKFAVGLTEEYSLLRQMVSFIKSDALYEQALPYIETTPFIIKRPRAFDARRNFYRDEMVQKTKSTELLELGCGEGNYLKSHLKQYTKVNSIEPDEEVFVDATHMVRKIKAEETITLHNTDAMSYLNSIDTLEGIDVLLTEVLEHIEYKESMHIISKVISLSPNKFLITLPNYDFNKYYGYKPGEFRHDDHLWEPSLSEFEFLVKKTKLHIKDQLKKSYNVEPYYIGDCEKSNPKNCATFAILITKS